MTGNRSAGDEHSVAEKVFAIADAFGIGTELSLSDIAQRANLPLSTVHRLLAEWVEWAASFAVTTDCTGVGMRLWKLGVRAPTARRMRMVALPFLEELHEVTRENVHLAIRVGLGALYRERFSGRGAVPVISDVGSRLPLRATGVGLVLLAPLPPAAIAPAMARGTELRLPPSSVYSVRRAMVALKRILIWGKYLRDHGCSGTRPGAQRLPLSGSLRHPRP